jgi:hypothetical protein
MEQVREVDEDGFAPVMPKGQMNESDMCHGVSCTSSFGIEQYYYETARLKFYDTVRVQVCYSYPAQVPID